MKKVYHIQVSELTNLSAGEYVKYNNEWKEIVEIDIEKGLLFNTGWVTLTDVLTRS